MPKHGNVVVSLFPPLSIACQFEFTLSPLRSREEDLQSVTSLTKITLSLSPFQCFALNSMASNPRRESKISTDNSNDDVWREIIGEERENHNRDLVNEQTQRQPRIAVTYQRSRVPSTAVPVQHSRKEGSSNSRASSNGSRVSFVHDPQRVSWNRSLSTRGRTSIAIIAVSDQQEKQQQGKPRRKPRPPLPRGNVKELPNFEKERAYFQEVDADELLEESPSPKKFAWVMGNQAENAIVPPLCTRLEKWLNGRRQHLIDSSSLSIILRTPGLPLEPIPYDNVILGSSYTGKVEDLSRQNMSGSGSVEFLHSEAEKANSYRLHLEDKDFDDIESEIRKLSLTQRPSSLGTNPFLALLNECGQSVPSTLLEVFSKLCEPGSIVKIGEGTYGEAFIAGGSVCKIVPVDGELRVNGEMQKRSLELLEEVILSLTLNRLRGNEVLVDNATTTFIQTKDIRVCQGHYDPALLRAWEAWDMEHGSENDHPKLFPENQCYVVSILEHGGTDLESFVLLDFNDVQSLLVQVTVALAVAEAAFQFEHRDLHWGNILLSRKETAVLPFTLEGKTMLLKTHGLFVSIIDFTLSRINTGNTILYLNLSLDPELFEGPKGDKQSETYRRMREVTDDCWEASFPKTNVLWLQYLVDILLLKKSFKRSGKDERELRSLKKRFNSYNSAKEALFDPFFSDLLVDHVM